MQLGVAVLLVITTTLVYGQVPPSWERNNNIDAGEVKPINAGVLPNDQRSANTTFNYQQRYNKLNFTVIPRVMMAQLNFGFPSNSSNNQSSMGYNITMGAINNVNFNFQVDTFGITIFALHFIYFAVSPIYDGIYHMENMYINFSTTETVRDIGSGAIRTQTVILNNPAATVTASNFSSTQILFQTWILSYTFTPSGFIDINTTSSLTSQSSFSLVITVKSDFSLQSLGITAILVNRTTLLQFSYTQYLDQFLTFIHGNGTFETFSTTLTDFNTMYFFRNTLFGYAGTQIAIDPAFTFFYYNISTSPISIVTSYGMNQRSRVCPVGNQFYFFQNQTCIPSCPQFYFTNTTFDFCKACHYSCQNCSSAGDQFSCNLCDSLQLRQLVNTSCTCQDHFFDNGVLLCAACDASCVTCQNNSVTGCLSCNATNNLVLVNGQCVPAGCGDGLLTIGQECDDGNAVGGDGCSSVCVVQTDHTCINNASLSSSSVCYYAGVVGMQLKYVFKVPLENKVELTVDISANNVNQQLLKSYLQGQTGIAFQTAARLLTVSAIANQANTFSTASSSLTIAFDYTQDISLPNINLQFVSSQSTSSSNKYFFDTPHTTSTLVSPSNRLLTTFLSDSQKSSLRLMSLWFLGVVVLFWVLIVVGMFLGQSAIAMEGFLVFQLAYESLLQSGFIYQGWSGFILYGKYSYGFNIDNLIETSPDDLTTIGLTIPLLNILNISVGIMVLTTLIVMSVFMYELVSFYKNQDEDIVSGQSAANIPVDSIHSEQGLGCKQIIVLWCMQIGLTLSFLLLRIVFMSISLGIRDGISVGLSLVPGLLVLGCSLVLWIFYFLSFNLPFLQDLSYRRLLRPINNYQKGQQQGNCNIRGILVRNHYILLLVLLLGFSFVNALSSLGIGVEVLIMVGAILWALLIIFNKHYLRTIHTVRTVINSITLLAFMVLMLLQTVTVSQPLQTTTTSIIGLVLLYTTLVLQGGVLVRIQYRRRRTKAKEGKERRRVKREKINHNTNNIEGHIVRYETEDPVREDHMMEDRQGRQGRQEVLQFQEIQFQGSHIGLANKSQGSYREGVSIPEQTAKKIIKESKEPKDILQTKKKDWNIKIDSSSSKLKTDPLHQLSSLPKFQQF